MKCLFRPGPWARSRQAKALYASQGLQLVRCFPRFYSFYNKRPGRRGRMPCEFSVSLRFQRSWDSLLYVLYINGGKPPDSLPLQANWRVLSNTVSPSRPFSPSLEVVQDEIAATLSCHSTLLAEYHYGPIQAQASLSFLKVSASSR